MKYLKIAALFSLINAIFFGTFLTVLYQQNLRLRPGESPSGATQNESVEPLLVPELPDSATTTFLEKNPIQRVQRLAEKSADLPIPASAPASVPVPVPNRCIVTVKGQRYDVTDFRKQHPGGDVFACNTDMTQVFFDQHDQQLLGGAEMIALKVR